MFQMQQRGYPTHVVIIIGLEAWIFVHCQQRRVAGFKKLLPYLHRELELPRQRRSRAEVGLARWIGFRPIAFA